MDNVIRSRRTIVLALRPCLFSKYTYMNQIIYFFMIRVIEKLRAFWLYKFLMIEIIKCALVAGWFAKQNMFSIIKPSWLKTDSLFWSSSKRMHMANNDWRCKLQKMCMIQNFTQCKYSIIKMMRNYWRCKLQKKMYDSEFCPL